MSKAYNDMTPQEKRLHTIKERYGSVRHMLSRRDVRDLILAGYNGGIQKTQKGFATWQADELKRFTKTRQRDSRGRFIPKTEEETDVRDKGSARSTG